MLIDGEVIASTHVLDVRNPYTGKTVGYVPIASKKDIERALTLAQQAKPLPYDERASFLRHIATALVAKKELFSRLIVDETGLSFKDASHEVERAIGTARTATSIVERPMRTYDITLPYLASNVPPKKPILNVIKEPIGLAVAITPFNHPINLVGHDVFSAIAAGVPLVLKPSPRTPLTALAFGKLLHEIGLPPNLLNIIVDDGEHTAETVADLVMFPGTELVLFTGSVPAGFSLARLIAKRENPLIRFIPECGGLSPFIVCEDADLDLAAELAVKGCFDHSGQRCTAIRKIIVMKKVADEFLKRFVKKTGELRWGNPYDITNDMGTVIDETAAIMMRFHVDAALKQGATLCFGHHDYPDHPALIAPTILDHIDLQMPLVMRETFGPIAPLIRATTLSEALELAQSPYKLAGAIVTASATAAYMAAEELSVGQFSWNGVPGYRTEAAPFGGFGWSGNGSKRGVVETMEAMLNKRTFYEH
jgi:aldehyde dehydrogenase (NAD+)